MSSQPGEIDLGLRGRVALVTGGGAGIGRAVARWLARAGCAVAVADIDGEAAAETTASLKADGGRSVATEIDVRAAEEVDRMVATCVEELGSVDVAVNNVGMTAGHPAGPFVDWSARAIRDVVEQNLLTSALCCRAEARAMIDGGGGGVILNVASGEATRPALSLAPYGAAKAGVVHLTQTLAVELAPHGIRVNAVAPGTTLTATVQASLSERYLEELEGTIPLGRINEPDDLARVAVFLASDVAQNVTGQLLLADNGAHLSRERPRLDTSSP